MLDDEGVIGILRDVGRNFWYLIALGDGLGPMGCFQNAFRYQSVDSGDGDEVVDLFCGSMSLLTRQGVEVKGAKVSDVARIRRHQRHRLRGEA